VTDEAWVDTVRLARDMGTVSELYPEGRSLLDLPHALFTAIRQGLAFLGFEELPLDEQPPRSIWLDAEALNEHFDEVKRRRKESASPDPIEDPVTNEAARSLIPRG